MRDTTKETLAAARRLIEAPEYWTKGHHARDRFGTGVDSTSSRAVCWCALGACERADPRNNGSAAKRALVLALEVVEPRDRVPASVAEFNDSETTTHADVLALFDRAIEARDA